MVDPPIIIPKKVGKDFAITAEWAESLREAIRRLSKKVNRANYRFQGTSEQMPFHLSAQSNGAAVMYQVSSFRSTIIDGTNGPIIDLSSAGFDTWTGLAETSYIYLKADVDSDLEIIPSSWALQATSVEDDTKEVETSGSPLEQIEIRLLIGKVECIVGGGVGIVQSIYQSAWSAYRIGYGFLNGALVKVFEPCHVHSSYSKE